MIVLVPKNNVELWREFSVVQGKAKVIVVLLYIKTSTIILWIGMAMAEKDIKSY